MNRSAHGTPSPTPLKKPANLRSPI
jgi:hypothetical protein